MKHKKKQKHLEGRHFIKTARMSRGPCNTQDKTPLPKSPLEAPACGQAEGKKSAFCTPLNVIFSPSKGCVEVHMFRKPRRDEDVFHEPLQKVSCTGDSEMPAFQPVRKRKSTERHIQAKLNSGDASQRRHKAEAPTQRQKAWEASSSESFPSISSKDKQNDAGPCNTQDKTPLPKSPLEAPACGQAEGKKSAFCTPLNVIFSPSKGCVEVHMFRKPRRDEDVFHEPLQKVSCTGDSEMPAFQPVRKRKSTERHIQAKLNSGDASQRRHKAEAPTQRQKAWEASSSESFPSISSKDKQNDAGPCNTQDKTPLPKSPLEAPACGQAEGKKSAFCTPLNVIFSPSKGCVEVHMFRKPRRDEDVFHEPLQKVSCTGDSEMPAFQPVRKRKSTERHIQAKLNSGDASQLRHKAEAPTQRQKAWEASSSESFPSISSKDKQNDAGPCNTQDKTPLPKSPLEAPACGQAEGKKSAFCTPLNVIFSPSKGCVEVHMFRKPRRDEDVFHEPLQKVSCTGDSEMPAFQPVRKRKSTERHIQAKLNSGDASQLRHKAEAPTQRQKAWEASSSESFPSISSKDKQNDAGPCNTQDKTPLPKSPLEAPACGQAEGKKSAFCTPLNVIFSPSKGCVEVHMFRKPRRDEDVFHEPLQKVSCTGDSEMPAFQPVRKRKSTERHIQAKLNSGDASQRRHKAEAPTQRQKAWEASSSESFPSISSKDKQNDAGPCNTQDKTPLPKSPLEAPACGQAEGKKSAFCTPLNVIFSPSKGCVEVHMFRKPRRDEDVFHEPLQKVSCTGDSEMPAFQPVRKRKSTERHIQAKLNSGDASQHRHKAETPTQRQKAWEASSSESFPSISSKDKQNDAGPCNTQDKTPLPKSPLEAPACGQAEGKKSAFCTPLNVIFSPSKGCVEVHMFRKPRRDEDVFHEPLQKVSYTGDSEMPAFQPVRKRKSTERHIQAKLNSGDASQRKHKAEAPTQRQKAWEASSSESFPSISSKDKQNDAGPCNTQDKTPLPKSPLEAPACGQAEGKNSAFCKPLNVIFSPSKGCVEVHMFRKPRRDEDVLYQPLQKVSCTGASEIPAFQPVRKRKSTERHIQAKQNSGDALQRRHKAEAPTQRQKAWKASSSESFPSISSKDKQNDAGPCNTQVKAPLPKSPLEAPAFGQAEGKTSAFCTPLNVIFSPSKGCVEVHMFRKPRRDEDVFHEPLQKVSCTGDSEMPAFQPVRKRKSTEQHIQGRRISHFNVPQPESPVEAPACGPAAGEKSSFSEHPIGVSTPSKRTRLYDDEIKAMTISLDSEQTENSSDYSHPYIPSHVPNNNEPFMSPVHGTDVRPMKIYYMHVQLKRGVAVLYHTKEGWEPPSKKIKMEEMTYIGKVHKNIPVYHMSEKKHLIAHEPMLDSGAQEKREEADSPAQPPALGGYPSAKTPEWLVALDSGFRCMACCRVFPNLKILQDHVEYGVREGFSCHVFHNAMAHLKFKST